MVIYNEGNSFLVLIKRRRERFVLLEHLRQTDEETGNVAL